MQRMTLTQFLIEERRRFPAATGELNGLLLSVAIACKSIATLVAAGALAPRRLDAAAGEAFLHCVDWGGHVAAMACGDLAAPLRAGGQDGGKYLLVFDALGGDAGLDVNVAPGSIFSILRAPEGIDPCEERAFRQQGAAQVAAGYAIYGPSTMLVLTVGSGVHGFTLERSIGEFILTHPQLRIPERACEFAIDTTGSRFWEAPVRRYVRECVAGTTGPRGRDFEVRWIASLVAEAHRILLRGGVFLYPRGARAGGMRLLHEASPIGWLVEQAGGRTSTGESPALALVPEGLQQRVPFVFGSREEVERIERYHAEDAAEAGLDLPLFQTRGLFRDPIGA
jgi:fructose-1,6-bisphosphatase I/sedoheptulose-1,7-bisphosphatase